GAVGGGQVRDDRAHVGPEPRFGRATGRLVGDTPSSPRCEPGRGGHRLGRLAQAGPVRVVVGGDAFGERGGGDHALRRRRQLGQSLRDGGGEEREVGGLEVPVVDGGVIEADAGGRGAGPVVVLADGGRRVVGREDETDGSVDAAGARRRHRVLD